MRCVRGMVEETCIWIMFQYTTLWRNWYISLIWNTSQWPKSLNWKPQKKSFFFLKRSYKIIPFNNNNAICQRNIMEQPSNMNFQFPGCSVFWEVLKNVWMKLRVYLLFLMATLYVYTIICIHSKFKKKILVCFLYFWCGLFVKFIFCLIYVYCLRELQ